MLQFFLPYTKVYDDDNDVRNVHFHSEGGRVEGEKEIKKWKIGSVQHKKKNAESKCFYLFHFLFFIYYLTVFLCIFRVDINNESKSSSRSNISNKKC